MHFMCHVGEVIQQMHGIALQELAREDIRRKRIRRSWRLL